VPSALNRHSFSASSSSSVSSSRAAPPVLKVVTISSDSSSDSDGNDFDQCSDTNRVVVNEVTETVYHGNCIDTTESDDNSMQTSLLAL